MNFDNILYQNNLGDWVRALIAALGINAMLFLLLPHLAGRENDPASLEKILPQINVVRIKRPDIEIKPPKEPPPKPKEEKTPPPPLPSAPSIPKPALPFEINPRLPSGPTTLDLPDIQTQAMGSLNLDQPFSSAQLDQPLRPLVQIPPLYPMGAKHRGVEGWVRVRFVVNTEGGVDRIEIIDADPKGVFEQSVRRCVAAWKFNPGTIEGMPVNARVETVIRFKLE